MPLININHLHEISKAMVQRVPQKAAEAAQAAAKEATKQARDAAVSSKSAAAAVKSVETEAASARANIESASRDALDAMHQSEDNAKLSENNAKSYEKSAEDWAQSSASPDGLSDTDSATGKTQSAKAWAAYAKQNAESVKTELDAFQPWKDKYDALYAKMADATNLNVRKTLGTEEEPYVMQWSDFDKIGVYHIAFSSEEVTSQIGDTIATSHDIYAFNTSGYGGLKSFSLIGTSPDLTDIFIGRFDDGTWSGWQEILEQGQAMRTQNIQVSQEAAGDGITVKKNDADLASISLGDPANSLWNVYSLEKQFYISNNILSRTEDYAVRIDGDSTIHTAKKTVAEQGMEVKQSLTIPTSDDGTGNIWIS